MIIYCGKCGKKLLPDDSAGGKVGVCAGCKAKIPIPKAGGKKGPLCLFCPKCEAKLGAPITLAGKEMTCPKCETKIGLPELEKKKSDTPGSKIIDSGLFSLEEVEELRKIPPPPPPTEDGRRGRPAEPEGAAVAPAGVGVSRSLVRAVVCIAVVAVILIGFIREAKLNLEVAEAGKLAAEEKFDDAVQALDAVIAHGALSVAKWRAAKLRPQYDRSARAREAHDEAVSFASENPEDHRGALALLNEAAEKFDDTPHGDRAAAKAKELSAKIDSLATPIHEKLMAKGRELVFEAKFDEAKQLYDSFPPGLLSPKWEEKCREARRNIADMTESVKKHLAQGAVLRNGQLITGDHAKQITREKFEQEQQAKGLVEYEGKWITKDEKEKLERERIDRRRREKGMVQIYRDKWISGEEADRRDRRVLIESGLPKGSGLILNDALSRAGMTGTSDADKPECAYLLRAKHKVDARPQLSSPEVGTFRVTVTLTVCRLTTENPDASREKLTIKEEPLFTLTETGRKMLARKDGATQTADTEVILATMETAAVANALSFLEHTLTERLLKVSGLVTEETIKFHHERAAAAMKSLRVVKSAGSRQKAVDRLVEIGADAVPALLEGIDDRDHAVRLCVIQALGDIGDPSAVNALRRIQVKAEAKEESAELGQAAGEAIAKILKKHREKIKQAQ